MAGFVIQGLEEAIEKMNKMAENVQKKHTKIAVKKALVPMLNDARNTAKQFDDPDSEERIYKNIVIQSGKSRNKNEIKGRVGIKGGAYADNKENRRKGRVGHANPNVGNRTNPGGDTWYWRLVEFGTAKTQAVPFMRVAFASNTQKSIDIFADEIKKGIMGDIR